MTQREKLEAIEDRLIFRMLELDERPGSEEYEQVSEELAIIQTVLLRHEDKPQ